MGRLSLPKSAANTRIATDEQIESLIEGWLLEGRFETAKRRIFALERVVDGDTFGIVDFRESLLAYFRMCHYHADRADVLAKVKQRLDAEKAAG